MVNRNLFGPAGKDVLLDPFSIFVADPGGIRPLRLRDGLCCPLAGLVPVVPRRPRYPDQSKGLSLGAGYFGQVNNELILRL